MNYFLVCLLLVVRKKQLYLIWHTLGMSLHLLVVSSVSTFILKGSEDRLKRQLDDVTTVPHDCIRGSSGVGPAATYSFVLYWTRDTRTLGFDLRIRKLYIYGQYPKSAVRSS